MQKTRKKPHKSDGAKNTEIQARVQAFKAEENPINQQQRAGAPTRLKAES
jgi:hypothetical protein